MDGLETMKRRAVTNLADSFARWKIAELGWNTEQARRLYHVNRQDVRRGDTTVTIRARDYGFLDQFDIREEQEFDARWIEVIADRK